jgi:hypothetical protein
MCRSRADERNEKPDAVPGFPYLCRSLGRNYTPLGVCDQWVETPHLVSPLRVKTGSALVEHKISAAR